MTLQRSKNKRKNKTKRFFTTFKKIDRTMDNDLTWEEFFDKYKDSFSRMVKRYCKPSATGVSYSDVEDITQEVFIEAWKADKNYDKNFSGGKSRVAYIRMCIYRKIKKLTAKQLKLKSQENLVSSDYLDETCEIKVSNKLHRLFNLAVEVLSEEDYYLFQEKFIKERSYVSIAREFGVRNTSIKLKIKEILDKLGGKLSFLEEGI